MVADDYFDLRSRLGAALFSLCRTADMAGLKPSRTPVVKSLVDGLRDPFVFVVAGEVNSGKSTLLNALFGEEFCPAGVLPETERIHYFRYAKTPCRTAVSDLLEEIGLPHAFLRDFHVVDTPGVNSIGQGHELITSDFIPRADAVLYCFPATNPWSAAGWEFLERIHRDWRKKIVLVLQQADLRTPEEIVAITEHMRGIARHRLGGEVPVFAVSARLALLARTSGVDKARLLTASHFPPLEQQLTSLVAGSPPRLGKLVTACAAGQAMLAEVQSNLAIAAASLTEWTQLKESSLATMDAAGHHAAREATAAARRLRDTWDSLTASGLVASLAERNRFPSLLWGRDRSAGTVESRLLPPLMAAVHENADQFHQALDLILEGLWKQPGAALQRALQSGVPHEPGLAGSSRGSIFTTLLENAACDAVTHSGLAGLWTARLQRRSQLMRGLTLVGLIPVAGLVAAGATGTLTLFGAGAATFLTAAGIAAGWKAGQRETAETAPAAGALLREAGERLQRDALALALTHGQQRLGEFAPALEPLTRAIELKQQAAAPVEEEASQLAQTLQVLSRTLRAGLG